VRLEAAVCFALSCIKAMNDDMVDNGNPRASKAGMKSAGLKRKTLTQAQF
jgi:hypothetical protein